MCQRLTVRRSHPAEVSTVGRGCVCGDQGVWDFSVLLFDFAGNLNLLKIEDLKKKKLTGRDGENYCQSIKEIISFAWCFETSKMFFLS